MSATHSPAMTRYLAAVDQIELDTAHLRETVDRLAAQGTYYMHDDLSSAAVRVAEGAAKLAGGEARGDYNGWRNRETWAVSLHLSNTETIYDVARILARGARADERIREYVEDIMAAAIDPAEELPAGVSRQDARLMAGDVGSLWRVDWRRVAEGLAEE